MKIIIKVLKGQDCSIEVLPTDTILSAKEKIEKILSIPIFSQKLLFQGRTLSDSNSIASYRVQDGSKLNLIVASKPDLLIIMQKTFRKHFPEAVAEKLAKDFVTIFNSKLKAMSLDDLERLSEQL